MKNRTRLLLVEDEAPQLEALRACFDADAFIVKAAASAEEALEHVRAFKPEIVLTDLRLNGMSGLELLRQLKLDTPEVEVIVVTAHGDVRTAVDAIRAGAADFIVKPIDLENLRQAVDNAIERCAMRQQPREAEPAAVKDTWGGIVTQDEAMLRLLGYARQAARSDATILIRGESGTGKEVLARAIHGESKRRAMPFVAINCAALNENLLESELFGHRKGSFTGALEDRIGRFEEAHNGTIFLDEIGDLSLALQVKLLRVLQEREIQRVGENRQITVNVRVICATNRHLERMVMGRTFREDLYYRLNVVSLVLPPLRERKGDIPLLVPHVLARLARQSNCQPPRVTDTALHALQQHDFPGNIRELENIIYRSLVMAPDQVVISTMQIASERASLSDLMLNMVAAEQSSHKFSDIIDTVERLVIGDVLRRTGNNQTKAAELLGLSERNLRYRIAKWRQA